MNQLLYILLFTSFIVQSQDLGDYRFYDNYYLKEMNVNGETIFFQNNDEFTDVEFNFIEDDNTIITTVCQTGTVSIIPEDFAFTLVPSLTFSNSSCQEGNNATFEDIYFNFFTAEEDGYFTMILGWLGDNDEETFIYIESGNGDYLYLENTRLLVNNLPSELNFNVYPNPVTENLMIDLVQNDSLELLVHDIKGNLLISKRAFNDEAINIAHFEKGVYFIRIKDVSGNVEVKKIIKN